ALGDLLLIDQKEAVPAECVFTDLVRSAPVVLRQMLYGFDVTLLGPGSQAPQMQVFEHTASECGHGHPPVHVGYDPSERVDTNRKIEGNSRSGKRERQAEHRGDSLQSYRVAVSFNWVGGRVAPPVLPHHRAYGSVHGGSRGP